MAGDRIEDTTRLLAAAAESFTDAHWAETGLERLEAARLGALRAAAAVLAARGAAGAAHRPVSVWQVLAGITPELAEWSEYFMMSEEHGPTDVRGVDDLLRAGEDFCQAVAAVLGLPCPSVPASLVPISCGPIHGTAAAGGSGGTRPGIAS